MGKELSILSRVTLDQPPPLPRFQTRGAPVSLVLGAGIG
jgi:hypothetical protein